MKLYTWTGRDYEKGLDENFSGYIYATLNEIFAIDEKNFDFSDNVTYCNIKLPKENVDGRKKPLERYTIPYIFIVHRKRVMHVLDRLDIQAICEILKDREVIG